MFEEAPLNWEAEAGKANSHVATAMLLENQAQTIHTIKNFGQDALRLIRAGGDIDADKASLIAHTCAQSAWMLLYIPDLTRARARHYLNLAKTFADEGTLMWAHIRFVESKMLLQNHENLPEALIAAQEASRYFLDQKENISHEVNVYAYHQCALAALELNLDDLAQEALDHAWQLLHPLLQSPTPPSPDDTNDIHSLIGLQGNIHEQNFLAIAERYNKRGRYGNTQSCLSEMKRYRPLSAHPLDIARRKIVEGEMHVGCMQYDSAEASFDEAYCIHREYRIINTPQYIRVLLGLLDIQYKTHAKLTHIDEVSALLDTLKYEPAHHFSKQRDELTYASAQSAIRGLK
jgi:hypothetical protein